MGAESGVYLLQTQKNQRELVQASRRKCVWLYVMDTEAAMVSVLQTGVVCVHDLRPLLQNSDSPKLKSTKLVSGALGGRCAMRHIHTDNSFFMCVVLAGHLLLMRWYAPRRKFMKLKVFR